MTLVYENVEGVKFGKFRGIFRFIFSNENKKRHFSMKVLNREPLPFDSVLLPR